MQQTRHTKNEERLSYIRYPGKFCTGIGFIAVICSSFFFLCIRLTIEGNSGTLTLLVHIDNRNMLPFVNQHPVSPSESQSIDL